MRVTLFAALCFSIYACSSSSPPIQVDTVYLNGTVVTVNEAGTTAEAVATRGDEIIAVGNNSEIEALAGRSTRVVNLEGKTMLPGFYAPHDHFPGAGTLATRSVNLNSPPMGEMRTIADVIAALRQKATETMSGEWVNGRGYDDTLLEEGRHPTRYDLDQASTEHPIYISHTSGHLAVANSLALEMAGVTRDTPQPPGGVIQKDPATGEPNGVFEESGGLVGRLLPPATEEERQEAIQAAVDIYVRQGVTTAVVTGGGRSNFVDLQKARDAGILGIRIVQMMSRGSPGVPTAAETAGIVSGFGDTRIRLGGIKIIQDGSNQGYTGYFTEPYHTPYHGDPDYRGYPRRSEQDLLVMVQELHRAGYQIAIHGNGDAAIDQILNAYEAAQAEYPRADARHRIEHTQLVRKDQLDRMAELGVTPSFFVGHVFYWGDRHRDIFMGPERAAGISPLRSARDRGLRFTIHDDTPVTPVDPLQLIWVSANRLTRTDQVLGPEERVEPEVALRALTADAAWQNFEEDIKGSIEPGKLADLVILSDNPLAVDTEAILEIVVLETIVGGETVYRAGTR